MFSFYLAMKLISSHILFSLKCCYYRNLTHGIKILLIYKSMHDSVISYMKTAKQTVQTSIVLSTLLKTNYSLFHFTVSINSSTCFTLIWVLHTTLNSTQCSIYAPLYGQLYCSIIYIIRAVKSTIYARVLKTKI